MSFEDVLTSIKTNVEYARGFCPEVEWSSEDATRTDFDFLCKCIESAINSGARVITIADTVGYTTPDEFYDLIKKIFNNVTNIDKAIFSVHCHNDLGLSVANSLAALKAGARQVHCTINGIGERAGNASLEEIVMAIKTRNKIYDFQLDINTQHLAKISKLVEKVTGFTVPPNKAIVGQNAFAHESGIHQHGVIINSSTYEIINPKEVGISASSLVIGKHSGKHALKEKVKDLGFNLDGINFDILLKKVKDFSLKNKKISDEDIINLIND
jgi:2-isopropylmalate synthase